MYVYPATQLTKNNSIYLCSGWETQTQLTSTEASDTQHKLQPALNLQLRTGNRLPSLPQNQLAGGRIYTLTFHGYRQCWQCCLLSCETKPTSKVRFLTRSPLLPADGGTWRSPFPNESWYPAIYCTRYSDPPCQLGVAWVEPLNWPLLPVFGLADNYNVLQFQPECLLKTFSTADEKNRDVLFNRIQFCVKIAFWLKSLSVSVFIHVTVY